MDHIQLENSDSLEVAWKIDGGTIVNYFGKKETNTFDWVEWIVMAILPLKLDPISVKTIMSGSLKLKMLVEEIIKLELPDTFVLIFAGWSSYGTHFLCIFAT